MERDSTADDPRQSGLETEWQVYMIRTRSGKLYTGITTDLQRRLSEHQGGSGMSKPKGAKFFRTSAATEVVYREVCASRAAASRREWAIKRLRRVEKLALIEQQAAFAAGKNPANI